MEGITLKNEHSTEGAYMIGYKLTAYDAERGIASSLHDGTIPYPLGGRVAPRGGVWLYDTPSDAYDASLSSAGKRQLGYLSHYALVTCETAGRP